jgi:hypothetical protein
MKARIVNYIGIPPRAELIFLAGRTASLDMADTYSFEDAMKGPQILLMNRTKIKILGPWPYT